MVLGSNENEYQEYFLGGNGDRYIHSYQLHVPTISESECLNLLEPSGPVIGIALLYLYDHLAVETCSRINFEKSL